MMTIRLLLLAAALLAGPSPTTSAQSRDDVIASPAPPRPTASAQSRDDVIAAPVLRASITVAADLVRIGDVIDNAGPSAQIAIYRAPDLGTTGSLPTARGVAGVRAHQVIGVVTGDINAISVTRLARTLEGKDIEVQVARALE